MSIAEDILEWLFNTFAAWVILVLIVVVIVGAGLALYSYTHPDPPERGYISEKQHHEAYNSYVLTGKIMVPVHHPERWVIVVNNKRACEVSESDWDALQLGQEFACN